MEHRVVITGMGAVTPVGTTAPETWNNLVAGVNGIGTITRFDTSDLKVTVAGEVKDLDAAERLGCDTRHMDLNVQYALIASDEAMADAGLTAEDEFDRDRVGVYVGSGIGGMISYTANVDTIRAKGMRRASPFMIPMMIANMAAARSPSATSSMVPPCPWSRPVHPAAHRRRGVPRHSPRLRRRHSSLAAPRAHSAPRPCRLHQLQGAHAQPRS